MHVKIYLRPDCPYSRRALQLLHDKRADVECVDVSQDPAFHDEMEALSRRDAVPQVFIGHRHVGGLDDLLALDTSGELDVLLYVGTPHDLTTSA